MIKDAQVRKLRRFLGEGFPLYLAALKVGMNTETARKYRHAERLPSESFTPRTWRTREDPFQDVWPEIRGVSGTQSRAPCQDPLRGSPAPIPGAVPGQPTPHLATEDQSVAGRRRRA